MNEDEELGFKRNEQGIETLRDETSDSKSSADATSAARTPYHFDMDEESILIEIPLPGIVFSSSPDPSSGTIAPQFTITARTGTSRLVPGFCTICLSGFVAGSDIVWSSNKQCEHCFHSECMEQWLTKQQHGEGPICPCCRRDFIFDAEEFMHKVQSDSSYSSSRPDDTSYENGSAPDRSHVSATSFELPPLRFAWVDDEITALGDVDDANPVPGLVGSPQSDTAV